MTASELVVEELDELEELELLELLDELIGGGRQGGTISVVTLLLAGSTSWSCGAAPVAACAPEPPGVIRIVEAGGGAIAPLELLELELLELELDGEPHGSIATVWVSVLLGITIWFEPGGIVLLPDWTTDASEHDVTAIVSGLCCWGMTTVRTPGLISAAATGSWLELLLLLEPPPPLEPQPVIATTAMHVATAATGRVTVERLLFMLSSGGRRGAVRARSRLSGCSALTR